MARVAVCVLGDVGRSPRMQYHALSTASCEGVSEVTLVGYNGEKCIPAVENHVKMRQWRFDPAVLPAYIPATVGLLLKALHTCLHMAWALLAIRPQVVLVQNPPCVPSVLAALLCTVLYGSVICVDWHNLGFSMVQHKYNVPEDHWLVAAARLVERVSTSFADYHICVTHAMRQWLREHFQIHSTCVHDKPPQQFAQVSVEQRHDLLTRLGFTDEKFGWPRMGENSTIQTYVDSTGVVKMRQDRAGMVVSSTSWTPDEDFSIFLDAIAHLDTWLAANQPNTRILCAVTGKGPLRSHYEQQIASMKLRNVACVCVWLEPADYPRMIASADVGVCVHTSTSGIDLPMKVLDMLGCGIAVCALDFPAMPELITHQQNGLTFSNSTELFGHLRTLFMGFPTPSRPWESTLGTLREAAQNTARWDDEWNEHMRPLMEQMVNHPKSSGAIVGVVLFAVFAVLLGWVPGFEGVVAR